MHSDALRRSAALVAWIALGAPAFAQEDHSAPRQDQKHVMMSWGTEFFVLSEVLELSPGLPGRPVQYDLLGWVGTATDRLFVKADGTQNTMSAEGNTELQLLYGRLISPFWDLQIGLRGELSYGEGAPRSRFHAALGVQGMAPGFFELEPTSRTWQCTIHRPPSSGTTPMSTVSFGWISSVSRKKGSSTAAPFLPGTLKNIPCRCIARRRRSPRCWRRCGGARLRRRRCRCGCWLLTAAAIRLSIGAARSCDGTPDGA